MQALATKPDKCLEGDLVSDDPAILNTRITVIAEEQSPDQNRTMAYFMPQANFLGNTLAKI